MQRHGMAKRAIKSDAAARGCRRSGGTAAENTENRPVLAVKTNETGQIFLQLRQKWLAKTPDERIRQAYVVMLTDEYGFNLDQMDEELRVAGRGAARARADVEAMILGTKPVA